MAIDSRATAGVSADWAAVLGRVQQPVGSPAAYGVAVESALEDLATAAATGRQLAPYLREATRVGCTPDQILVALDEVRGSGAPAPPL